MEEKPYDLMEGVLTSKANEHMIGFAGFMKPEAGGTSALEGVVKVSAFHRPDSSGYLTLTFIIDREPGVADSALRLGKLDPTALQQRLGSNFEMLIDLPLNEFSEASPFLIEEMDVYFRQLQGQESKLIESGVFPAFNELLGLQFEPLQAWEPEEESPLSRLLAEAEAKVEAEAKAAVQQEPKSLLKRLFGRD